MEIEVVLQTRCGCRRTLWLPKRVDSLEVPLKANEPSPFQEDPPIERLKSSRTFRLAGNDKILALPLFLEV